MDPRVGGSSACDSDANARTFSRGPRVELLEAGSPVILGDERACVGSAISYALWVLRLWGVWGLVLVAACGSRSALDEDPDFEPKPRREAQDERCNGLDEDLDGHVDEDFRSVDGQYVTQEHCGGCERPCTVRTHERSAKCTEIDGVALCAATACADGFVVSVGGRCVPAFDRLCLPCVDDGDCGPARSARCVDLAGEHRC